MERARYIRFKQGCSPMSPGRGGAEISKAHTREDGERAKTVGSHELMDEILVGDFWVALRKVVKDSSGKEYLATRKLPRDCVRDYEPAPQRKNEKEPTE